MPDLKKPPEVESDAFKSAKWDELTAGRRYRYADAPNLAILCQWHKILHQAVAELDAAGGETTYENKMGDIKAMPQIATIKTASAEIRQLDKLLGIEDGAVGQARSAEVTPLAIIQGRRSEKARAAGA